LWFVEQTGDYATPRFHHIRYATMVSYTLVNVGHGSVISIGIFETREQAAEANRMVRELAQTEFKHLMPRLPIARVGEIVGHFGK
jgi:hypothetical protein